MIRGFHLVWTAYGWWFPNDPRGSWSEEVWAPTIQGLGERRLGRRPDQPTPEALRAWLAAAQRHLRHEPVILTGAEGRAAAMATGEQVERHDYELWALAVLPDHVHVVVRRHAHTYERIRKGLKAVASRAVRERRTPFSRALQSASPSERRRHATPIWSRNGWARYLNTDADIAGAVRYVENNPVRTNLRRQRWSFVKPFEPRAEERG